MPLTSGLFRLPGQAAYVGDTGFHPTAFGPATFDCSATSYSKITGVRGEMYASSLIGAILALSKPAAVRDVTFDVSSIDDYRGASAMAMWDEKANFDGGATAESTIAAITSGIAARELRGAFESAFVDCSCELAGFHARYSNAVNKAVRDELL